MKGGTISSSGRVEVGVGSQLGSYRLVSLLGKGSMGTVFRARHLKLGRAVAVKVLNPEYATRPDVLRRFFREAQVVNQIGHEHIVDVTDLVELPGCAFLVMELLEGQTLRQATRRKRHRWPTIRRAVEIMIQVCDALEAAHEHGVVHRDLKPDNVFVLKRGGRDYAKVLDFGVAKLKEPDAQSTAAGMILGTPLYMAPEQATGRPVDRAADIWAAGVVLYELLSGAVPFEASTFPELVAKLREDPAPPLPDKTPRGERTSPALRAAVMRCLEKRPSDRFHSMDALAGALSTAEGAVRPGTDRRWIAAWAVAVLLAGTAAATLRHGIPRRLERALAPALWAEPSGPANPNASPPPTAPPTPAQKLASSAHPPVIQAPTRASTPEVTPPAKLSPVLASAPHRRRVEKVAVELYSKPSGARVVRLDTGESLGKTPARVRVPKRSGEIALRFNLAGYEPITASVDLATGGSATVAMRKTDKKTKSKRRHSATNARRSGG